MFQIMGNPAEVGDMGAKIKSGQCPHGNPKSPAKGIEDQKPLPIHVQHARHDAVQLTQDVDESCESDSERTVPDEKSFDPVEAIGIDSNPCSVAQDNGAAKPPSNPITNVVSEHGTRPSGQHQKRERQFSAPRENGRKNKQRLARQGNSERLEGQYDHDREGTVLADKRFQVSKEVLDSTHRCLSASGEAWPAYSSASIKPYNAWRLASHEPHRRRNAKIYSWPGKAALMVAATCSASMPLPCS